MKRGQYKKRERTGNCLLCSEPFSTENPYFSSQFHRQCYNMNYKRLKYRDEIQKEKNKKYNVKEVKPIIEFKINKRVSYIQSENIDKKENIKLLNWIKKKIKTQGGYIDAVDCFRLCHLYEVYGNKDLSIYTVKKQLILMWEFLKDFEYQ